MDCPDQRGPDPAYRPLMQLVAGAKNARLARSRPDRWRAWRAVGRKLEDRSAPLFQLTMVPPRVFR